MSSLHQQFLHPIQRILNASSASSSQLSDLLALPADAHQIQRPLLVLLLEELNRERLGPSFDDIARLGDHLVEGLERHAVVRDALPFVIHVDVQLRAFEELESSQVVSKICGRRCGTIHSPNVNAIRRA
jgi:hypothetical protein